MPKLPHRGGGLEKRLTDNSSIIRELFFFILTDNPIYYPCEPLVGPKRGVFITDNPDYYPWEGLFFTEIIRDDLLKDAKKTWRWSPKNGTFPVGGYSLGHQNKTFFY